uniref:Lysosomal-associated transmembrane protein 4A n=1 Tax=Arion vulgaris TaxID=1028688 RepID=A0A0B7AJW2_9EUPU
MIMMLKYSDTLPGVDPRSYRCCLCCHVKTGTLLYGIFVALVDLLVLGLLVFAAIRPDVLISQTEQRIDGFMLVQTNNGSFYKNFGYESYKQQINKDNLSLMFGLTLICFVSTLALVYGVARNVAGYLMPFFCMQVFDFCLCCLVTVGCFTYAPNVKHWIHDQGLQNYPGMDHLLSMDSDYLLLIFVAVLIFVLSVKAYFICMVWSCYKYIQLHVAARSISREYNVDANAEMLLPPCYEDAIKVSCQQPPAYSSE